MGAVCFLLALLARPVRPLMDICVHIFDQPWDNSPATPSLM